MKAIREKAKERGYWEFVIRPSRFEERKLSSLTSLRSIVERCSVQLRGWEFPHVERGKDPEKGLDWIEEGTDWEHYIETWRMFQSGQFYYVRALWEDWRDRSEFWPPGNGWTTMSGLGVGDVIDTCTEFFEFASRWSQTEAGDDHIVVHATLRNLAGRRLQMDRRHRAPLRNPYSTTIREYPYRGSLARAELIAHTRELALDLAKEIFERFGWNPPPVILRELQEEIGGA